MCFFSVFTNSLKYSIIGYQTQEKTEELAMRTGELANLLGVNTTTVINWVDRYGEFFSEAARGIGVTQRTYTEADMKVLNTVREMRSNGESWNDIRQAMSDGVRVEDLPQNAVSFDRRTIPVSQAALAVDMAQVIAEKDSAMMEVARLRSEIERIQNRFDMKEDSYQSTIRALEREVGQLSAELRILKGS